MQRWRRGAAVGLVLVALAGAGVLGWWSIPYVPPAGQQARPASVADEIAYVERWWQHPNPAYGDFGGTDCVNFTSQALVARGWAMDAGWGTSVVLGRRRATSSWVSSTAMMRWLATRPDLAVPLDDDQRDRVAVGDIAQFDWDASGDRDHTGVVTAVDGDRVEIAQHSPAGLHADVDVLIDEHGGRGTVHFWHLLR